MGWTLYNTPAVDLNALLIWATIENGLAIICACLPTYRPLLPKGSILDSTLGKWYKSLLSSTHTRRGTGAKPTANSDLRNQYNQIEDGTADHVHLTEAIGGDKVGGTYVAGRDYPLNAIKVTDDVGIV